MKIVALLCVAAGCSGFSIAPRPTLRRMASPLMNADEPIVDLQQREGKGSPRADEVIDVTPPAPDLDVPSGPPAAESYSPLEVVWNNLGSIGFLLFIGINLWAVVDPSSNYNQNLAAGAISLPGS